MGNLGVPHTLTLLKEQAKKNQVAGGELKGKLCQNSDKGRLPRARSNSTFRTIVCLNNYQRIYSLQDYN